MQQLFLFFLINTSHSAIIHRTSLYVTLISYTLRHMQIDRMRLLAALDHRIYQRTLKVLGLDIVKTTYQ